MAYRMDEAIAAAAQLEFPALLIVEGEKCVEALRVIGLAAITLQGSSWGKDLEGVIETIAATCPQICLVMLPDFDDAGKQKGKKVREQCGRVGLPCVVVDPKSVYPDLPEKGDCVEMLEAMGSDDFIRKLEDEMHRSVERWEKEFNVEDSTSTPDGFSPDAEFIQEAFNTLYGDKPWICVSDVLHYWTGTHYTESPDVAEKRRIRNFCNSYAVTNKEGDIKYPYAKPAKVKEVLEWVKISLGVNPKLTNPPGLNCTNGILQISWEGAKASWNLINHDPNFYYLYEPKVTYKPEADPVHCDRLLEALSEPEREILLRTIAASLDLSKVRKFKGRMVRALLCKGDGSNGKDALKALVSQMYGGVGLTGKTLSDFAAYDAGRKFPLAGLLNSRVNWSSENANTSQLDKIQSLKNFITGDNLDFESKGKDEIEFQPVAIALFNINDVPNLSGSLEAIQSRYAVLSFHKTFKIGADPAKGEIEADPRFKYDPEFISEQVLPAFLNRVLQALEDLMREGINYEPTRKTLEGIQAQNSHLFQFCQDLGLTYAPESIVTIGEIWDKLRQWYLDNGTLSLEETLTGKEKFIWLDQVSKRDANVKGANQVLARFLQILPKGKRVSLPNHRIGISGIGFIDPGSQLGSQLGASWEPVGSQLGSQLPLQNKGWEPMYPVSSFDAEKKVEAIALQQNLESNLPIAEYEDKELPTLAPNPDTVRVTASQLPPELPPNCLPTASQPEINIGSRIKVNLPDSKHTHGLEGVVLEVRQGNELPYVVSLETDKAWLRRYEAKADWLVAIV
jgi:putative DNA primase/helicase